MTLAVEDPAMLEIRTPKMIDNKRNGRVIDELRSNLRKGSRLSVISAYFTIYAYAALKKELSRIDKMRFLFTESPFAESDEVKREFYIDNKRRSVAGNECEIKLRNEMKQAAIARECAKWLEEKVEVKSLRSPNSAQPRLVHIENSSDAVSINGTIDFTTDGLGVTHSNRIDSNMCLYGKEFTSHFLQMFDELWSDSHAVLDIKEKLIEQMKQLYQENTPEFIYFVTLHALFSDYLDDLAEDRILRSGTGFTDSLIWNKLYKFQRDGVMGAINRLEKHSGCIIADSVGLGKTFTALAVIKYYELRNDRVLVLVPKKLRENWTIYTLNDKRNLFLADRFRFDVLNHTDLSRTSGFSDTINLATVNWSNYDLIVIDESHNFRNNHPTKGKKTRYERMMDEVIKAGVKTKVLMLSATPVNNRMNDIKNQIAFISEGDDKAFESLGLKSIEFALRKAQTVFNAWSKLSEARRTTDNFVEMMNTEYFKLLDAVTIARSRKHIEKYYNLDGIGKFPVRRKPENRKSDIDQKQEFPPIEQVNRTIRKLNFGVYSPLLYVRLDKASLYHDKYDVEVADGRSTFKQTDRDRQLVNLIRINLLKRLESSVFSFTKTISKILDKINEALARIDSAEYEESVDVDIADLNFDENEYDERMVGKKVKVMLQDVDLIKWRQDLEEDRGRLESLLNEAVKIEPERDGKLVELKRLIDGKIRNPFNTENKKILIFSAFADTAHYLYNCLAPWILENYGLYSAAVTGSGHNKTTLPIPKELKNKVKISDLNTVLTLFSPRSKECDKIFPEMQGRIDILIGTDCISEGQNLQDCDYLVNYDIHWNPVRIIQRFGRIDRIGSVNGEIQLVNFWPNIELDEYIKLEARVQGRMVLLDVSATGEENLIENDERAQMNDLQYRKTQLERLQTEVVDLEDISGGISITDLTFDEFRNDLMEYMRENRKKLKDAPMGMYAVCKASCGESIAPGVIFTLRQLGGRAQTREQNVFFPYYMVYITEGGEVLWNFLHAKKILDGYRRLCNGQKEVLTEWVEEFNRETKDGRSMSKYSGLLETAVQKLIGKKQDEGIASLFSKGGTTLPGELFDGLEDFELVSFLVVK